MRRPARLERAGALTPRDRVWLAIRSFGKGTAFSIAELVLVGGDAADGPTLRADTTLAYVLALAMAGYVREDRSRVLVTPRRELRSFRLERDVGVHAPRVGNDGRPVTHGRGREQMWTFMRKARTPFDWRWLVQNASTPQHQIAMYEAKDYLKCLSRAGYLRELTRGAGGRPSTFEFVRVRNTGPRAPWIDRNKNVFDGNTGKLAPPDRATAAEDVPQERSACVIPLFSLGEIDR